MPCRVAVPPRRPVLPCRRRRAAVPLRRRRALLPPSAVLQPRCCAVSQAGVERRGSLNFQAFTAALGCGYVLGLLPELADQPAADAADGAGADGAAGAGAGAGAGGSLSRALSGAFHIVLDAYLLFDVQGRGVVFRQEVLIGDG